ncbi:uncharacterized protein LOC110667692 isoform X2 [Hevea brasiliensis]|uniref:uncharacterized protein LOC110667692 isoform X2 n=1 Tax=Hevea brasiliensis TaxID=3981 RepID=UPI0025FCB576|nr:uncharacterized protein LOC110667692 isoform X2 [Hevea brasiliensis]
MCTVRKGKEKVVHMPDSTMHKWKEAWSRPDFKARSEQFTANYRSETGGVRAGISRYTRDSLSHALHAERLKSQLGQAPLPYELFESTYTRKGTSDLVGVRAQSIKIT